MTMYAIEQARNHLGKLLGEACGATGVDIKQTPPNIPADLAVPVFKLAQREGRNPAELALDLASRLDLAETLFADVTASGGFLNFSYDPVRFGTTVLASFAELGEAYGGSVEGAGKTIVIDYSSPNIAKPFSVGHLRSTIIGHSLKRIFTFMGFRVIGDNHIGDWGTQFGKLLCAFEVYGNREKIASNPIEELLQLYVRFHEEAEKNPDLNNEARAWFKRLETGDSDAQALWTWFRDISWEEFQRVYDLLGVEFEEVLGESFYNQRLSGVVQEAFDRGLAVWGEVDGSIAEEGIPQNDELSEREEKFALIHLDAYDIDTPLIIQKSDGTSLYATRDLATAKYRIERWNPEEILYVVGSEQSLYFRQVFKALELLGYPNKCVHVAFGLIRLPEGRMSTRKGRVIFLEDVLGEATSRAAAILADRDMTPEEKQVVARIVGIGAVKYADLSQSRMKEVVFDWDRMLNMQGDSAPYLQYAYARIQSILRKATGAIAPPAAGASLLQRPEEIELTKNLAEFPEIVRLAARSYSPHVIAGYLFPLAQCFNLFYREVPVLKAEDPLLVQARLFLCQCCAQVIRRGLFLLGIEVPDEM